MIIVFAVFLLSLLVVTALAIVRSTNLFASVMLTSIFSLLMAANVFGTKTALLLAVIAFLYERPDFLDLALAYALINMVGILAVLEFFQNRRRPSEGASGD